MSLFSHRVMLAVAVLSACLCNVASAQVSFGFGNAAHREAETRIIEALESREVFILHDVPLTNFVQWLRDRFDIQVLIHRKALADFGVDTATPITVHLPDATLESSLNFVLGELDLTWTIRHEALLITTQDQAEASMELRVYPARDLVLIFSERLDDADFDSLIQLITSVVQPDSWDEVGGPGAIEADFASLSLVIRQTWRVHRQLEQLLTNLRTARDKQGIAPVAGVSRRAAAAKPLGRPPRRYSSSANSSWLVPRVYD